MLNEARDALNRVSKDLEYQLRGAKRDVQNIESMNSEASSQDETISK